MASIVTVQPAPIVSVFCAMEAAINSVPAGPLTVVLPVPVMPSTFLTPWEISRPVAVLLLTMSSERLVVISVNGSPVPPAVKVPPFMSKVAPDDAIVTGAGAAVELYRARSLFVEHSIPTRQAGAGDHPECRTKRRGHTLDHGETGAPDASSLMIRLPLMLPSTLPMKVQLLNLSVKPVDCGRSFEALAALSAA